MQISVLPLSNLLVANVITCLMKALFSYLTLRVHYVVNTTPLKYIFLDRPYSTNFFVKCHILRVLGQIFSLKYSNLFEL